MPSFDLNFRLMEQIRESEIEIGRLRSERDKLKQEVESVIRFQAEHFSSLDAHEREELRDLRQDMADLIHWVRADLEDERDTREHPGICIDRDYAAQNAFYHRLGILPLDREPPPEVVTVLPPFRSWEERAEQLRSVNPINDEVPF